MLAEGTQGHLTGAAIDHFGLEGENPQIWALGVKEVWRVPKPLDRIIHTMGWPLRGAAKYREFGGSFVYPMGDDMVSLGIVVGLDYRDVELSVHDLLQEFKTHPMIRKILEGGERSPGARRRSPRAAAYALPKRAARAGAPARGDGAGLVERARAEGHPLRDRVGQARRRGGVRALQRGERLALGALDGYDDAVRDELRLAGTCTRCATCARRSGKGFFIGGALASAMTATKGKLPPTDSRHEPDADAGAHPHRPRAALPGARRQAHVRQALVGLRVRQPHPRRPAEPRPRRDARAARGRGDVGEHVPGAGLRGRRRGRRLVSVEVTPSNCVQCGAITAKGGRLTPPEGGSGPEYTLT